MGRRGPQPSGKTLDEMPQWVRDGVLDALDEGSESVASIRKRFGLLKRGMTKPWFKRFAQRRRAGKGKTRTNVAKSDLDVAQLETVLYESLMAKARSDNIEPYAIVSAMSMLLRRRELELKEKADERTGAKHDAEMDLLKQRAEKAKFESDEEQSAEEKAANFKRVVHKLYDVVLDGR